MRREATCFHWLSSHASSNSVSMSCKGVRVRCSWGASLADLWQVTLYNKGFSVFLLKHLQKRPQIFVIRFKVKNICPAIAEKWLDYNTPVLAAKIFNRLSIARYQSIRQQTLEMSYEEFFWCVAHLFWVVDHKGIWTDVL